jgi:hypothetical protein
MLIISWVKHLKTKIHKPQFFIGKKLSKLTKRLYLMEKKLHLKLTLIKQNQTYNMFLISLKIYKNNKNPKKILNPTINKINPTINLTNNKITVTNKNKIIQIRKIHKIKIHNLIKIEKRITKTHNPKTTNLPIQKTSHNKTNLHKITIKAENKILHKIIQIIISNSNFMNTYNNIHNNYNNSKNTI